jgi:hypothetical protein
MNITEVNMDMNPPSLLLIDKQLLAVYLLFDILEAFLDTVILYYGDVS